MSKWIFQYKNYTPIHLTIKFCVIEFGLHINRMDFFMQHSSQVRMPDFFFWWWVHESIYMHAIYLIKKLSVSFLLYNLQCCICLLKL